MTEEIRKYNNRDVRADRDRLTAIAYAYLARYAGNWEVLLSAKEAAKEGHGLTDHGLRVVLNSMLSDPSVRNMPEPLGHTVVFEADQFVAGKTNMIAIPERKAGRPVILDLKAKINLDNRFWYGTQRNAYLIHLGKGARVTYHTPEYYTNPNTWWSSIPPYAERFDVRLQAFCKSMKNHKFLRSATEGKVLELLDDGLRWCPTCIALWDDIPGAPPLPGRTIPPFGED